MPVSNLLSQAANALTGDASAPPEEERIIIDDARQQFLKFYLDSDTAALLPVAHLTEVLKVPIETVVPIPHMPEWVMGIYNWRSEILWMVDLAKLVGLSSWHQSSARSAVYTAIVLNVASAEEGVTPDNPGTPVGLIVSGADDIEWCNPDDLQFPPSMSISPTLAAFLRGYWLKSDEEMLAVLDSKAIVAAMPQAVD